jgi:hypothetical protein
LVGGGDAGIAEQMAYAADRLTTLRHRWLCDVDFGHGFWTPIAALVVGEWRVSRKRSVADSAPINSSVAVAVAVAVAVGPAS